MTPAARVAAAIEILDETQTGAPVEKTLTKWSRAHRYAGSGDRAAIRDHVFSVLRRQNSCAELGGGETGRALMIGHLRLSDVELAEMFSGVGYAPAPFDEAEQALIAENSATSSTSNNIPEWLEPQLKASLGDGFDAYAKILQTRAPLFLRVNLRKSTVDEAIASLQGEDIAAETHPASPTALLITSNPRRVQNCAAYKTGMVEIQDAGSQAVVDLLPLEAGKRVLDYCAGGGGKSLAMAGRSEVDITAYDVSNHRMKDLPFRADRSGVHISRIEDIAALEEQTFDMVLCDVPCSGSGSWRRAPQAKWLLTEERLAELCGIQATIMGEVAADLIGDGGVLAYVTCSVLDCENGDQVAAFMSLNPEWKLQSEHKLTPENDADGFYLALLTRE